MKKARLRGQRQAFFVFRRVLTFEKETTEQIIAWSVENASTECDGERE